MKLSHWAKTQGIKYKTAYKWFKNNTLPVKAKQFETGTIIVYPEQQENINEYNVIYARVSSNEQKHDLERQIERLKDYAANKGYTIHNVVSEIASGLNDNRKKLNKILQDKKITTIIVEHKDRLTRFGFNHIQSALNASNRNVIVANETEKNIDLIQDFIDVVTSLCAKIYGKRSAKNKAMRALKEIEKNGKDELS